MPATGGFGEAAVSNEEIATHLAAIAQKQDDLILLFAGRLDWNAAETAARFRGGEPAHTGFEDGDGRIAYPAAYPVASAINPP